MRSDGFVRGIVFAAVAAAASVAWLVVLGPWCGTRMAFGLGVVALATAYLAGLAPDLRRLLAVVGGVGCVGLALLLLAPGASELVLGLAAVLGVVRSGFLFRRPPGRAVLTEALFVTLGLVFANVFAGPSLRSVLLAVWAFFLVQSFFFLVPAPPEQGRGRGLDPFESAHRAAMALLDRAG